MSPVDPLPPRSPWLYSSESPTETGEVCHFIYQPTTPVLSPSHRLQHLVTTFNVVENVSNPRKSSASSLPLTPSPLELEKTSATPSGISADPLYFHLDRACAGRPSLCDLDEINTMCQPDEHTFTLNSILQYPLPPKLRRQNAMDGLSAMILDCPNFVADDVGAVLPYAESETRVSVDSSEHWDNNDLHHRAMDPCRETRRAVINTDAHLDHPEALSAPLLYIKKPHPLRDVLQHLGTTLVPLISVRSGLAHPEFPCSLLQFHLLTHDQLDSLAQWYHQSIDAGEERWKYPAPIAEGKAWVFGTDTGATAQQEALQIDLNSKRRRWGRFIGLRGCESPVCYNPDEAEETDDKEKSEGEEVLAQKMERQWKAALRKAEEEGQIAEKMAWRRS